MLNQTFSKREIKFLTKIQNSEKTENLSATFTPIGRPFVPPAAHFNHEIKTNLAHTDLNSDHVSTKGRTVLTSKPLQPT